MHVVQVLANTLKFFVAFFIWRGVYAQLIVYLFYMFPKSVYYSYKGETRISSIFATLISPGIIFVLFFIIGLTFPASFNYIEQPAIGIAANLAIVSVVFQSFFIRASREQLNSNYQLSFGRYSKYGKFYQTL